MAFVSMQSNCSFKLRHFVKYYALKLYMLKQFNVNLSFLNITHIISNSLFDIITFLYNYKCIRIIKYY